ncbi:MAG TPA: YdeI/OmpD-associated family protein [Opitutus sp.]|nr:YdeI/OmpD-associated family protein [Opitutus sp.]
MKTTDPRIDAYIGKSAEFAQPILRHLRKVVRAGCPAAEETMKWSMPSFVHAGKILAGMAAFKAHCTFGFWHQGMHAALEKEGFDSERAMGNFGRITSLEELPDEKTLVRFVRAAAALSESGERARPVRPKRKKAELKVPADLVAALTKNRAAAKTWGGFSYSHRKEYIEWITEAKRDETRAKRLATTLEWLAERKPRNWKYMNC